MDMFAILINSLLALVFGVLILFFPHFLSYFIAAYLLIIGLVGVTISFPGYIE